ncbi:murein transglycosylase domain-containing protein [Pseudoalteromonas sp. SMS1]|uniref:murein transglycosylase domain-containing protein n=1 Tax=Pseudoalteromonas sp. SMS1 TaxID=2908894 RepID=UPI001F43E6E3|nr:murein transglycosylase domain-containing protein [Pseudoalteromonas sp. SMS1]MCF2860383.1 murein transglycosylase domain-containing protein [Pseudoalteromonas sp. SMS1]
MKKVLALTVLSQLVIGASYANSASPFDELSKEMEGYDSKGQTSPEDAQTLSEFEQFKAAHLGEYEQFVEQHLAEYDAFRDELIKHWGEAKVASRNEYVSYSEDNLSRLEIDFENNELTLSIRHDGEGAPSESDIKREFERFRQSENAVLQSFLNGETAKISDAPHAAYKIDRSLKVNAIIDAKAKIKQQTIEQKQLLDKKADEKLALTQSDASDVVEKLNADKAKLEQLEVKRIQNLAQSVRQIAGQNDEKVTKVTIKLPQGSLAKKRASHYTEHISKQSERFDIDSSLVLAVMHTESHFNPLAKSHIPAYGLMQVVPTSAGVDVNRFLFKIDAPMSAPYLFVVNNNIEAGTAYLHLLNDRYLRHIKDPVSRKYCMIAAYNTGAGNVARVFNSDGSRNIYSASKVINSMSPERVLEALQSGLPYDETKHYLKKVLKTEKLYI